MSLIVEDRILFWMNLFTFVGSGMGIAICFASSNFWWAAYSVPWFLWATGYLLKEIHMALARNKLDTLRLLRQSAVEHLVHHQALLGDGNPETVRANVQREIDIWQGKVESYTCALAIIEGEKEGDG